MIAGIDTTRLKVFREVAGKRSFTQAATLLNISQPAVSQHVARLEKELGFPLLERTSRQVRLTAAGEVFLRHVDTLLTGLDDARRELTALATSASGQVRMVVFPSAAATFAPSAIGEFRTTYPGVSVAMSEADPPVGVPRLLAGDVDLAVVYDYPLLGLPRDSRLGWESLGLDAMAAAVRADSPLATATGSLPLARLAAEDWIVPGPSMCRDALQEACRRARFRPRVVSETNDYQAMLGLVAAGVGVAVVPGMIGMMPRPRSVVLLPLTGTRLAREVAVVHRRPAAVPPAMAGLRSMLGRALTAGSAGGSAREAAA
ncbi:LysR family transcriptional regulator [Catenulispora subtropica]|uniref:LysR family transcriptional regulator n=1 Tax=Catenulispora subtropica TaxID=450798 RepID=A0ABN2SL10_9ACTN